MRSGAHSLLSLPVRSLHGTWTFGPESLCLTSSQLPSKGHVESVLGRDEAEPHGPLKHPPPPAVAESPQKSKEGKAGPAATIQMPGAEGEAL